MFRTLLCPILLPHLFLPIGSRRALRLSKHQLLSVSLSRITERKPDPAASIPRVSFSALLLSVLLTQLARSGSVWTKGCDNVVEPVGPDMSPSHFNRQNMWRGRSSLCHYAVRPIVYSDILVSAAASMGGGGGGGSRTDRCATYSVGRPL